MFINRYDNQVVLLILSKGSGWLHLKYKTEFLCHLGSSVLKWYWKFTGISCLFFFPVFKNITCVLTAILSMAPLLLRQEEHHGELGKQAAEAGITKTGYGEDAKKQMILWVCFPLVEEAFYSHPCPILLKGPQAKHLQCWLAYTASPSETEVVHIMWCQFDTLTSSC